MPFFGPNIEKLKERGDVDGLINALSYKDWHIRRRAAAALGDIGDVRAVHPLMRLMIEAESAPPLAEVQTVVKLGGVGFAGIRPSPAYEAQQSGLEAFVKIGTSYPDVLYAALEGAPDFVKFRAAKALGQLSDEKGIAWLISALNGEDWHVRLRAAEILGEVGNASALEQLEELAASCSECLEVWSAKGGGEAQSLAMSLFGSAPSWDQLAETYRKAGSAARNIRYGKR